MARKFHPGPPDTEVELDSLSDQELHLSLRLTIQDQKLADETYKLLNICMGEDIAGISEFVRTGVSGKFVTDWLQARHNSRFISRRETIRRISNQLRENMEANKIYAPGPNFDAHHIVGLTDERAETARAVLTMFGIDINHPTNGVYLPSDSKYIPHPDMPNIQKSHRETHTRLYHKTVLRRLNATVSKGGGKKDIIKTLSAIATELEKGVFPI
ncbi:AHH domain-containing protein [Microbulbifer sp. JMSA004]|uniref:AHH domain-containing protein n=1 Tax=Microbulbifer sp. JMSA004 TaxID=3243370 RepID=UPI004039520A